jgi:SAM-dependent methyltransferase
MENTTAGQGISGRHGWHLFLVGFLVLFLELACIRWFAAYVIFLQFFTNVVLIASFLGMSCGCLAARRRFDWLAVFPLIALGTVAAALAVFVAYHLWAGFVIDVGGQASPQEIFFGTEYRNPDVARFVVPIEAIAALFFVLIALMFVGLCQVLGRAFDAFPNRVLGYTLNIGGSVAGIVAFSVLSFAQTPPVLWFLVCFAGIAYLLRRNAALNPPRALALVALLALVGLFGIRGEQVTRWSPYYAISREPNGLINVNTISHQMMLPFAEKGAPYSLIHLLQKHSGGAPFADMLVIGAGSGNDLAHALRQGVGRIDAVEIDPVIQDIGIRHHPDQPYADPRVVRHLDDGRHYLRTTDRQYDVVVYALVDSLILHSGYANIRLESYLFTEEAFADVKRVLKPGGMFVMYNYYRRGWVVERVAAMAEKVFGCTPLVLSMPNIGALETVETLRTGDDAGFTVVIAGCNPRIADAMREHGAFWLNTVPPRNLDVDGFILDPASPAGGGEGKWSRIAPTTLMHDGGPVRLTSDDWPFLYLRGAVLPDLSLRSMLLLGALGMAMVYFFLPAGPLRLDSRMFFLGAAFMLLETRAVVQMALLFGSTWVVNSAVFLTVLVLILLANLHVLMAKSLGLPWYYGGLFLFLLAAVLTPLDAFLGGGVLWGYAVPCVLALAPIYFAGVIFARSFRDSAHPDHAFGANIAGAVVGGLVEAFSMVLGFRYLLVLAMLLYALSIWSPALRLRRPA